jgi:ankyrin repeat protein
MDIRSAVLGARNGDALPVLAWLDGRGDPDYTDHTGVRLLHIAADYRHPPIVKLLLERGANPNVVNRDGRTPLYEAVDELTRRSDERRVRGNEIVRILLAAKADPGLGVQLPLAEAAGNGNVEAVRALLASGAQVNQGDPQYYSTALIDAVNGAQPEMVKLLLAAGADIKQADRRGQTPLLRAIENPGTVGDSQERRALCIELARFLVAMGADVNDFTEGGWSPLMAAVNENWPEMIRFLLDAGADVKFINGKGRGLARVAVDGVLRLNLADGPALELVRSVVDAGARDLKDAADWARQRKRIALADAIERLG